MTPFLSQWWLPPPDDLSRSLAFGGMPPSLFGFVRRVSIWSQLWNSLLAIGVFGYMFYLQPLLAVVSFAMFSPQFVFVPLMQRAINRRVRARIAVLRQASVGVLLQKTSDVERALQQELRFAEIFELNLGIFKLRYSMKFLMNLTQNFGKVVILGVGGWYVIHGQAEVGTVVAFISGLNSLADPWHDLVTWYQDMMVTGAKYQVYVTAIRKFASGEDPSVL